MLYVHITHTHTHTCTGTCNYMYVYIYIYIYRIAGFCREDFNLAIGSIRDFKIRDHFILDIL